MHSIFTHKNLMSKKKNIYIPKSRHNPEIQAQRIEKLSKKIQMHEEVLTSVIESYDKHIEHLSSFAKHDMGNSIQSLYAILKLLKNKLSEDDHLAIKTSVDNLQTTLNNFEQMVPYTKTQGFQLNKLMVAVETLTRYQAGANGLVQTYLYDRDDTTVICQPFQAILQVVQNFVLNSIKALKDINGEKRIEIEANITDNICSIAVKDNGCGIEDDNVNKVFEYKYTTTDGSGIGLFHAKHVCSEINGDIAIDRNVDGFTTIFTLKFNIDGNKTNSDN